MELIITVPDDKIECYYIRKENCIVPVQIDPMSADTNELEQRIWKTIRNLFNKEYSSTYKKVWNVSDEII